MCFCSRELIVLRCGAFPGVCLSLGPLSPFHTARLSWGCGGGGGGDEGRPATSLHLTSSIASGAKKRGPWRCGPASVRSSEVYSDAAFVVQPQAGWSQAGCAAPVEAKQESGASAQRNCS